MGSYFAAADKFQKANNHAIKQSSISIKQALKQFQ
jgi:hypothetical protein